jgi:hypothetical protein
MIIKVPIYVEISTVDQRDLPVLVDELMKKMYNFLRKEESINTLTYSHKNMRLKEFQRLTMKIISREKALENLRTSK